MNSKEKDDSNEKIKATLDAWTAYRKVLKIQFLAMMGLGVASMIGIPILFLVSGYQTGKKMDKVDPLEHRTEFVEPVNVQLKTQDNYKTLQLTAVRNNDTVRLNKNIYDNTDVFIRTESTLSSRSIPIEEIIRELHEDINDGIRTKSVGLIYKKRKSDTLRGLNMRMDHMRENIYFLEN